MVARSRTIAEATLRPRIQLAGDAIPVPPDPEADIAPRAIRAIVNGREVNEGDGATQPLFPPESRSRMWQLHDDKKDDEEIALEIVKLSEAMQYHVDCWAECLLRKNLPTGWRGRADILHYETLVCGFKRILKPDPVRGRGYRVRRKGWLRRARHDDQHAATKWFRELSAETRAELAHSYLFEDVAQQAEKRYIARANRDHRAELEILNRKQK